MAGFWPFSFKTTYAPVSTDANVFLKQLQESNLFFDPISWLLSTDSRSWLSTLAFSSVAINLIF
ncbi:hypothetical protein AKG30_07475 [Lacticaseibacillus paracasei]|nr:hypothetical protein AKG30_07475 [Lacticaseibacillus paracasei]